MGKRTAKEDQTGKAVFTYEDAIAKKRDLQERGEAVKAEVEVASGIRDEKRLKAGEASLQVSRFRETMGGAGADAGYEASKLQELVAEAEAAYAEERQANEKYDRLSEEINTIEAELRECTCFITVDDVLQYQKDIAEAERKVSGIENLFELQQRVISEARAGIPQAADHRQARENMLADVAAGNATDKDLAKLEDKIRSETTAIKDATAKAMPIIETAQQTIAGLQRRLEGAISERDTLKKKKAEIISFFLTSEAEQIGEEYVSLALQLIDKFKRLRAVDELLGNRRFTCVNHREFFIPAFNLKAFAEVTGSNHSYGRFTEVAKVLQSDEVLTAIEEEKKRFETMGIALFA